MELMEEHRIPELRNEIDRIDRQIVELLVQRAARALEIGSFKRSNGLPTLDAMRERDLLDAVCKDNKGPLSDAALRNIFTEIVSACRSLQGPTRVAYLGPEATFSHLAATEHFGKSCIFRPTESIADVFREVESGQSEFGVVPVENSSEGGVGMTLDRLVGSELRICGEITRSISHALMSKQKNLSGIQCVYSHPQALGQCLKWLATNLPGRSMVQVSSTAAAAKRASEEPHAAAVGCDMLAAIYGLEVLAGDIQDRSPNLTRFLILGRHESERTGRDKTSILFVTPHKPGALRDALAPFDDEGINLSRIESRPAKDRTWEYIFFADFEGHLSDRPVQAALESLAVRVEKLKILGSYPIGEVIDRRSSPVPLVPRSDRTEIPTGACCGTGKEVEVQAGSAARSTANG